MILKLTLHSDPKNAHNDFQICSFGNTLPHTSLESRIITCIYLFSSVIWIWSWCLRQITECNSTWHDMNIKCLISSSLSYERKYVTSFVSCFHCDCPLGCIFMWIKCFWTLICSKFIVVWSEFCKFSVNNHKFDHNLSKPVLKSKSICN